MKRKDHFQSFTLSSWRNEFQIVAIETRKILRFLRAPRSRNYRRERISRHFFPICRLSQRSQHRSHSSSSHLSSVQGQPVVDKVLLLSSKESSLSPDEEKNPPPFAAAEASVTKGRKFPKERAIDRRTRQDSLAIHGCVAINETISPIGLQRRCKRDRLRQRLKGRDRRAQAEPASSGLSNPPCPSSTWIVDGGGKRERQRGRESLFELRECGETIQGAWWISMMLKFLRHTVETVFVKQFLYQNYGGEVVSWAFLSTVIFLKSIFQSQKLISEKFLYL